jgi:hypothetical protein
MQQSELHQWQTVSGAEIETAISLGQSLEGLVQPVEAVYLWRRAFVPPEHIVYNAVAFEEWLSACLQQPVAVLAARRLAHFFTIDRATVGGGSLPPEKIDTLRAFLSTPKRKKYLQKFVRSMADLAPPLYVGETCNLRRRTREHILGQTDFSRTVTETLLIPWRELQLMYWGFGGDRIEGEETEGTRANRTLFELITARATVAGSSRRPG